MTRILFRDLPDAGLWRRIAALFYDGLLIGALWFVLGFIVAIARSAGRAVDTAGPVQPLVSPEIAPFVTLPVMWLVAAGFYALFWSRGGQTLGMKTWRLRVVTIDGTPLSARAIILRCLVGTLSVLCGFAGMLWVLVDGRTWHDRASGTRVVAMPKES